MEKDVTVACTYLTLKPEREGRMRRMPDLSQPREDTSALMRRSWPGPLSAVFIQIGGFCFGMTDARIRDFRGLVSRSTN